MPENRVVVTGLGAVTPIGTGLAEFWRGLAAGRSGTGKITHFDSSGYTSQMAAEVKDFDPGKWIDPKAAGRMDRFTQFAMAASHMAFTDAGLNETAFDNFRAGVIIGSGIGGSKTIEDGQVRLQKKGPRSINPFLVSKLLINMAACMVSITFRLKGPLSAPSVACSTGANAIGDAYRILQRGDADIMLAGASEACITPLAYGGFCATRSMSRNNDDMGKASRPFDKNRDGFVMGEGCGIAVLENLEHALNRGASIYAEIAGYGNSSDAYHITAPDPEGNGMIRVMRKALEDAGISPRDVDHINAHGTSTQLNDKTETAAIHEVFGDHAAQIKISSIKSMIGHLMSAAGAVEFVSMALTMQNNIIPPTINYEEPDPLCGLNLVTHKAQPAEVNTAISNSFGFGGGNVCLVLKEYL
ncbi:MAG: beta-ketoacyl-ACP synthase II [Candidatus Aminicenantaceae bacterium]